MILLEVELEVGGALRVFHRVALAVVAAVAVAARAVLGEELGALDVGVFAEQRRRAGGEA